jgi:hypothetical protein
MTRRRVHLKHGAPRENGGSSLTTRAESTLVAISLRTGLTREALTLTHFAIVANRARVIELVVATRQAAFRHTGRPSRRAWCFVSPSSRRISRFLYGLYSGGARPWGCASMPATPEEGSNPDHFRRQPRSERGSLVMVFDRNVGGEHASPGRNRGPRAVEFQHPSEHCRGRACPFCAAARNRTETGELPSRPLSRTRTDA